MMSFDVLLKNPDDMSMWLNERAAKDFFLYLKSVREFEVAKLTKAIKPEEIYRIQGDIARLDALLGLPKAVAKHMEERTRR